MTRLKGIVKSKSQRSEFASLKLSAAILISSIIVSLLIAEVALRIFGYKPMQSVVGPANEPLMLEPDTELGWRNKPGKYVYPGYSEEVKEVTTTIGELYNRAASYSPDNSLPAMIITGGSFVMGHAISDQETFSWQLQEDFPDLRVINLGTGAYGTYQSFLLLKSTLAKGVKPKFILYGLYEQHEDRNVASARWIKDLKRGSYRGHVSQPHVEFTDNGELLTYPGTTYPSFPLVGSSALMHLAADWYNQFSAKKREKNMVQATEQLLLMFNNLAKKHAAEFLVFLLAGKEPGDFEGEYMHFLSKNNIHNVSCLYEFRPDRQVKGEGHPNAAMHDLWGDCISEKLREILIKR